jgi:transcriptional regulator with XRE-family HTH domain
MNEATTGPIDAVLSANVARLRQGKEWSQAQLARAVRHHGLAWTRATVAQVETGGRALSAKEVLVLAAVFGTALATLYESDAPVVMVGDAPWSAPWYAAVLVGAYDSVPAKLRPRSSEGSDYVARVQRAVENTMAGRKRFGARWGVDDLPNAAFDALFFAHGDTEVKAARRIGDRTKTLVGANDVAAACMTLWGAEPAGPSGEGFWGRFREWPELWTLNDERDRRVAARGGNDMEARRLQALRGHVMREMDRELEAAITAAYDREDYRVQATERD